MFNKSNVPGLFLKGALVFGVSAGIWLLFWFHDRLYQYGLVSLTVFGGLGVAALIFAISWLTRTDRPLRRRCKFSVYFPKEDTMNVILGTITLVATPIENEHPPRIGMICNARAVDHSHQPFAYLRVNNIERRIIGDLENHELERMGFDDLESFCQASGYIQSPVSTEDEVALVDFEVLDKGRL